MITRINFVFKTQKCRARGDVTKHCRNHSPSTETISTAFQFYNHPMSALTFAVVGKLWLGQREGVTHAKHFIGFRHVRCYVI